MTSDVQQMKHREVFGKAVSFTYNMTQNFMGYAVSLTDEELEFVLNDPIVKYVHYDHEVHVFDPEQSECDSRQTNVRSWGICRTSHYGKISDHENALGVYMWEAGWAGAGTHVYVIDTGIRTTHRDFEGRAVFGANFVDTTEGDDNGHGTHCAGTIAGATVGLARDCRVIGVRVLNRQGSGTLAGVAAGCNWVAQQHVEQKVPSVASMSLGGGWSQVLNDAVDGMIDNGVCSVVAAGNDNADACNYSPASVERAITVGSTTTDASDNDVRSSFSNKGDCVDFFAPGSNIASCGITSDTAYATMSGTSMACPHVAALAAIILQEYPHLSPTAVKTQMINEGNWDVVGDNQSKNNALAYSGC